MCVCKEGGGGRVEKEDKVCLAESCQRSGKEKGGLT